MSSRICTRTRVQYIQSLAERFVMNGGKAYGWNTATDDERAEAKVLIDRMFAREEFDQSKVTAAS